MIVYTADLGALAVMLGSFLGVFPAIAGFLATIWYAIQIWESDTAKRFLGRK
jgi:hypothetical protein